MDTIDYREIIAQSETGFAFFRFINDETGKPYDYEIIDVNNSFTGITGIKKDEIQGRRLTEIIPYISDSSLNRIDLFGNAVINNRDEEFEYYNESLQKWYRVRVTPHNDHLITIAYYDITESKQTERQLTNSTIVLGQKIMGMNLLIYLSRMIHKKGVTLNDIFQETIDRVSYAFSSRGTSCSLIKYGDEIYRSNDFRSSTVRLSADISVKGRNAGTIEVYYPDDLTGNKLSLMNEEHVFLSTIARYLGQFIEKVESDEELKQSREKLLQYMKFAPDAIFIADMNGHYISVNPAACTLLGYTEDELLNMSIPDILPSELRIKGMEGFRNLTAEGIQKAETIFLNKNGSRVWISLDAVKIPDGTFMAFCRDISDRKKAEKELAHSALFNKTLLNTIPAPIYYKDKNGRYMGINNSFVRFYGKSEQDIIGKTVFEIYPHEFAEIYHKTDNDLLNSPGVYVYESRFQDSENKIHDILFHKTTFTDVEGNTGGIIGVMLDITERKKAEKELKLYFRAMQSIDQPVLITDSAGNIIKVNNAFIKMYGYTAEETAGINPRLLNPGKDVYMNFGYEEKDYEKLFRSMWHAISDPSVGTWEGVVINRKKDGALIWVKLLINTIYNEEHVPAYYIALPIDISSSVHSETMTRIQLYQTIAALAELRDNETGNHMRRVGIFSKLLARECHMPEKYCNDIEIFAPMHDIGKVGILDSILLAERKLTLEEFEIMKTHTHLGYNIVKGKKELEMVAAVTIGHHEKYDGTGYPAGLRGDEIPFSARITAIVDVYDALRSRRPYKDGWNHEQAKEYIISNAGKHFDPDLVSHFIKIHNRFESIYNELKD